MVVLHDAVRKALTSTLPCPAMAIGAGLAHDGISPPRPGQIVRIRQRKYLVEEVILGESSQESTVARLACIDDDAQGQDLEVFWEKEVDAEVLDGTAWRDLAARGFDEARLFSSYLHALRWNCVTSTDPKLFQSP